MSGQPVALKVLNKINRRPKFLYRKNKLLKPELRMFCNALNQTNFEYVCQAWYPNLNKNKAKTKMQNI